MKSTAFVILLVAIACSSVCQAESRVSTQSKKQAEAVLQSIVQSLNTDDDTATAIQEDDSPDSLLLSQSKVLPSKPKLAGAAASYANLQKFAAAQGYVRIPYWMWKRYWPLYYFSYYRFRVLRLIHKGH